jgi:hypothetical protein
VAPYAFHTQTGVREHLQTPPLDLASTILAPTVRALVESFERFVDPLESVFQALSQGKIPRLLKHACGVIGHVIAIARPLLFTHT